MSRLLTVTDVCARLNISRAHAYRVMGQCLHVRVGRCLRDGR